MAAPGEEGQDGGDLLLLPVQAPTQMGPPALPGHGLPCPSAGPTACTSDTGCGNRRNARCRGRCKCRERPGRGSCAREAGLGQALAAARKWPSAVPWGAHGGRHRPKQAAPGLVVGQGGRACSAASEKTAPWPPSWGPSAAAEALPDPLLGLVTLRLCSTLRSATRPPSQVPLLLTFPLWPCPVPMSPCGSLRSNSWLKRRRRPSRAAGESPSWGFWGSPGQEELPRAAPRTDQPLLPRGGLGAGSGGARSPPVGAELGPRLQGT